jgi:hypothetical protein
MKEINLNELYKIFEKDDLEVYEKHSLQDIFREESVIFSTVVRSITNFFTLEESQRGKFKEEYSKIQDKVKFKYFCKYFNLLNSLPQPTHQAIDPSVLDLGLETIIENLQLLLEFFISIEHYEKCSRINEFIIFIDNNYKSDR